MHQVFIGILLIASGVFFAISGYLILFWLKRMSWERLNGTVVGHERTMLGDDFCENAVIEVTTATEVHHFSSLVASDPPLKLGTTVTVLKKPRSDEFVELSILNTFLFTVGPLLCGAVLLWLALNTSWDAPTQKNEAEQAGSGQPATRPQSDFEGSDKPQPESEGRSR